MEGFLGLVTIVDQFIRGTAPSGQRARAFFLAAGIAASAWVLYGKDDSFYDQWQQDHKNLTTLTDVVVHGQAQLIARIGRDETAGAHTADRVTSLEAEYGDLNIRVHVLDATTVKHR